MSGSNRNETAFMSNILQSLSEQVGHMKRGDQRIARYILDNPHEVVHMGITELSEASGSSTAAISRFCRLMFFKGYPDFKMKLATELAKQPVQAGRKEKYQDITEGASFHEIVQDIQSNHIRAINETAGLVSPADWNKALEEVIRASHIEIFGVGTSALVAQDLCHKLRRIGLNAHASPDSHLQITSAANLGETDLAIAFSYSGETPEIIESLTCAKEQGAASISITRYGVNQLSRLADIRLFCSSVEAGLWRGDMSSRISQLHVVDMLFTGLLSGHFQQFIPRLEQTYRSVSKYRGTSKE